MEKLKRFLRKSWAIIGGVLTIAYLTYEMVRNRPRPKPAPAVPDRAPDQGELPLPQPDVPAQELPPPSAPPRPSAPARVGKWLGICLMIVAGFEGLFTVVYLDPVGIPTYCYGETEEVQAARKMKLTPEYCKELLAEKLQRYHRDMMRHVKVPLNYNEEAAYTSFVYNVGVGAWQKSTLLKKLNAGDHTGACNELFKWDKARKGGVLITLPGLTVRRKAENALCLKKPANDNVEVREAA